MSTLSNSSHAEAAAAADESDLELEQAPVPSSPSHASVSAASRPRSRQASIKTQLAAALQRNFYTVLPGEESESDEEETVTAEEEGEGCAPDTPRSGKQQGSKWRGVTKHKRTQRYEAHIWFEKKQIYLGGFASEVMAAKSHDVMALRCKGWDPEQLNFPRADYARILSLVEKLSREEVITALRNFSKAQTAKRCGKSGGVRKVTASKTRAGSSHAPPSEEATSPRKLSIRTKRRRAAHAALEDATEGCIEEGPEEGDTLHPRQSKRLRQAHPPAPFTPTASLRSGVPVGASRALRSLKPAHSDQALPTAAASAGPGPPSLRPLIQRLLSDVSVAGPAYALSPSASAALGQMAPGLSMGSHGPAGAHHPPAAGPGAAFNGVPLFSPFACQAGEAPWGGCAGLVGAGPSAPRAACGGAPAPKQAGDVAALDTVDLESVLSVLTPREESSLTFSTSEEGRLFEWMPVDSGRSGLEHHATGAMLICSPEQQREHQQEASELSQDTSATSMLLDAMSASAAQQAAWAKGPGPYTQEQCPVTCQEQQASPAGPDPGARYACWAPPFTYADPLLNLFLP